VSEEMSRLAEEVVAVAKELDRLGLVEHSSGNVSVRVGERVLITPSGVPYRRLSAEEMAVLDMDGNQVEGPVPASIERGMHVGIYVARKDVQAVVHSHPIYASAFAAARKPLPPVIDDMAVYIGGEVDVAGYGIAGSPELAQATVEGIGQKGAVLLANHGLVACGKDLDEALHVTNLVERGAIICLGAQSLGGVADRPVEAASLFEQVYRYKHSA